MIVHSSCAKVGHRQAPLTKKPSRLTRQGFFFKCSNFAGVSARYIGPNGKVRELLVLLDVQTMLIHCCVLNRFGCGVRIAR